MRVLRAEESVYEGRAWSLKLYISFSRPIHHLHFAFLIHWIVGFQKLLRSFWEEGALTVKRVRPY